MKIGRNDLCPCGSGKKYKNCCYLQNNSLDTESDVEEFENQALLLQALNNIRSYSLDNKSHVKEYYKIRKMHSEVVNSMASYHEAGKFELKIDDNYNNEDIIKNAETLQLIKSDFDLETREGAQALYDLLIYKGSPNKNCITEDFIQSHRYRKPEKIEFLHSMLESRLGLFEIIKTDFNEGYVYLKDIFTDVEYKIVDVALSGSQVYDDLYMYTRLINYYDITFNTGLSLIFDKEDSFIKDFIREQKKDYTSEGEFLRFIQLYNCYSKNPDKIGILTNTIK